MKLIGNGDRRAPAQRMEGVQNLNFLPQTPDSGHYEVASDRGAVGWAMIASLLETCKLNQVDPLAWTTDVLTKLVNRWPASRIDELMPWAYTAKSA